MPPADRTDFARRANHASKWNRERLCTAFMLPRPLPAGPPRSSPPLTN
jgi:hypothetical protein